MIDKLLARVVKHRFEKGFTYTPIVTDVTGTYDIPYSMDGNAMHLMDVYYPKEGRGPYPVILYIHGGAWVACDKNMNRAYCEYLASFGYCVLNMSYRLLPKTDLKGQLQDVVTAINCFLSLPMETIAEVSQLVLMGDSAGAHIASLLYCLMQDQKQQSKFNISMKALPIKALVLQNMVSDLSVFTNAKAWYLREMMHLLFGRHYKQSDILHISSFLEAVHEDIAKVPVILVGSEHDPLYEQTKRMQDYLTMHAWECTAIIWTKNDPEKLGHVFQVINHLWEESRQTHERIFRRLQEVLKDEHRTEAAS